MEILKDFLLSAGLTGLLTLVISIMVVIVKKGQFELMGKKIGRLLSKLGRSKLGNKVWEKMEDVITLSILSFAKGIKLGADEDDNDNKEDGA